MTRRFVTVPMSRAEATEVARLLAVILADSEEWAGFDLQAIRRIDHKLGIRLAAAGWAAEIA